jgi:CubicO group peptidase (beta-lactamase class C family)
VQTLHKAHFGTLLAEDKSTLNDRALFRMASMTKPVTAVAIIALYDKGLIDIDDPVLKYLPQFEGRYIVKMTQALCYL